MSKFFKITSLILALLTISTTAFAAEPNYYHLTTSSDYENYKLSQRLQEQAEKRERERRNAVIAAGVIGGIVFTVGIVTTAVCISKAHEDKPRF